MIKLEKAGEVLVDLREMNQGRPERPSLIDAHPVEAGWCG
jgi:hypothetical protein